MEWEKGEKPHTAARGSTTAGSSGCEVQGPCAPCWPLRWATALGLPPPQEAAGCFSQRYLAVLLPLTLFPLFAFGPSRSCLSPFRNLGFLLPDKTSASNPSSFGGERGLVYGPTALLSYLHTCPSELQVRPSSASTSEQDFAAASQRGVQLPALPSPCLSHCRS